MQTAMSVGLRNAILPPIVSVAPSTINATYATALAAVADGQSFGVPTADNSRLYVYLRVSATVGRLTSVQPYISPARATVDAMASLTQRLPLPLSPIVDIDTADIFYSTQAIRNRAPGGKVAALNMLEGYSYQNLQHTTVGTTVTARQADNIGGTNAVRVQITGSVTANTNYFGINARIPPGQWTLWFWARLHGGAGTPVTVKVGSNNLNNQTDYLIGTAWQRIQGATMLWSTEAGGRTQIIANSIDGISADIDVCDFSVTPGIADPGSANTAVRVAPFNIQLDVGFGGTTELRAAGAGAINGNGLIISLPTDLSYPSWSMVMMLSLSDGAIDYSTLISANAAAGTNQLVMLNQYTTDTLQTCRAITKLFAQWNGNGAPHGLFISNLGKVVLGLSVDAGGFRSYINGVRVHYNIRSTIALSTISNLMLNGYGLANDTVGTRPQYGDLASFGFWTSALTDADMAAVQIRMARRAAAHGWTLVNQKNLVLTEGDSITEGQGDSVTAGYMGRGMSLLTGIPPAGCNEAISGATLTNVEARLTANVALITSTIAAGYRVVVSLLIGSNDAAGSVSTQAQADSYWIRLKAYMDALRTAGAKVVYCTQIAMAPSPNYDSTSTGVIASGVLTGNTYAGWKAYLRGLALNDATHYDAVCDFQANANLVTSNGTYFAADTIHPNNAGHALMAPIWAAAVQPFLI